METESAEDISSATRAAAIAFSILCLVGAAIIGYLAAMTGSLASTTFLRYMTGALALTAAAGLVFSRSAHLNQSSLTFACVASTAGTTLAVLADYTNATALVMFYLWISLFAWYFLDFHHGVFINLLIVLCYMVVLTRLVAPARYPIHLLTMIGSLSSAGVVIEIGKRQVASLMERLAQAAITDPLTGLSNRRSFESMSNAEVARCTRYGSTISLLMLDIDHFKRINDTWGHQTGDEILQFVGTSLATIKRDSDIVARIGGEEFVCMLPETDTEGAVTFANRIRALMSERILDDGRPLTTSVGVAEFRRHGLTIDELLHAADAALYRAKELGRNRVEVADG